MSSKWHPQENAIQKKLKYFYRQKKGTKERNGTN
jgi:hypothetical protein